MYIVSNVVCSWYHRTYTVHHLFLFRRWGFQYSRSCVRIIETQKLNRLFINDCRGLSEYQILIANSFSEFSWPIYHSIIDLTGHHIELCNLQTRAPSQLRIWPPSNPRWPHGFIAYDWQILWRQGHSAQRRGDQWNEESDLFVVQIRCVEFRRWLPDSLDVFWARYTLRIYWLRKKINIHI